MARVPPNVDHHAVLLAGLSRYAEQQLSVRGLRSESHQASLRRLRASDPDLRSLKRELARYDELPFWRRWWQRLFTPIEAKRALLYFGTLQELSAQLYGPLSADANPAALRLAVQELLACLAKLSYWSRLQSVRRDFIAYAEHWLRESSATSAASRELVRSASPAPPRASPGGSSASAAPLTSALAAEPTYPLLRIGRGLAQEEIQSAFRKATQRLKAHPDFHLDFEAKARATDLFLQLTRELKQALREAKLTVPQQQRALKTSLEEFNEQVRRFKADLRDTREELAETAVKLAAAAAAGAETAAAGARTATELTDTRAELTDTRAELTDTKTKLAAAEERLARLEALVLGSGGLSPEAERPAAGGAGSVGGESRLFSTSALSAVGADARPAASGVSVRSYAGQST